MAKIILLKSRGRIRNQQVSAELSLLHNSSFLATSSICRLAWQIYLFSLEPLMITASHNYWWTYLFQYLKRFSRYQNYYISSLQISQLSLQIMKMIDHMQYKTHFIIMLLSSLFLKNLFNESNHIKSYLISSFVFWK